MCLDYLYLCLRIGHGPVVLDVKGRVHVLGLTHLIQTMSELS